MQHLMLQGYLITLVTDAMKNNVSSRCIVSISD